MLLSLNQKYKQAGDITTFVFTPLEPIEWIAGQSIKLEVEGVYGPTEHRFSIASAPYEKNIAITTRVSDSPFKTALNNLKPGDTIRAYSVDGQFTWREAGDLQRIFVAAGIGITPFHAMLKQRRHEGKPLHATIVYGGTGQHFAYRPTLDTWKQEHPELAVHYVENEHITPQHVFERSADITNSLIYIAGPTGLVDQLGANLKHAYDIPEDHLVSDWFTGL